MFKVSLSRVAALALVAGLGFAGTVSNAAAQTLEKIKEAGVMRVGVMGEQAPWGSIDASGQNIGYDVDVAQLMAKELGVKVEFVANAVAARIPNLLTNKVDVQMAVMGMYPDRAKVVQFSKPYAGLKIILLSSAKNKIETIEDARNLRIGVPRGAAQDKAITALLGDSPNIRRFDDDSSNIQALVSGQVDAIGGNTTYKINLDRAAPGNDFEQKLVFNEQWMGATTRPGDAEMNGWLNAFIDKIKANGELQKISEKWLDAPLPTFPESLEGVPFAAK
ncbi:transporter substrate-binding domain-containing protein [Aureimonas pseudogalii]|jgi:polar amino acid transport system substrate-binding protein|uniref:Polar amino acid transport system substrate-binding protein n=1 Tax=Aureimonas pseudogalii TaxID=1744844 RepID=A0A7W6MLU4_9HYPH|nr:transporter substrate-binding domain-containing protein [Aureimonas pseudogalii]MBB4000185.1 polar amino acid transport system substrate-binding protein [Aureimonas pseudogalii]